jgi:hypothetical protein
MITANDGAQLKLSTVLVYLDECDACLLAELELARDLLHHRPPNGWTIAQIIHHLILAEKIMLPIWEVVPRLARWPALITAMDRANISLWRALGMKTLEPGGDRLSPANAVTGRFRTPVFLDPPRRPFTCDQLVERRRAIRSRTLRALNRLDEETLHRLRWSLPHSGSYTLIELARFIGIHEIHHVPQIRRIIACSS